MYSVAHVQRGPCMALHRHIGRGTYRAWHIWRVGGICMSKIEKNRKIEIKIEKSTKIEKPRQFEKPRHFFEHKFEPKHNHIFNWSIMKHICSILVGRSQKMVSFTLRGFTHSI